MYVRGQGNYTISYTSGTVEGSLRDGHILPVHLSLAQPLGIFTYEHYDPGVQPVLEFVGLNDTVLSSMNVTARFIKKQSKDDYSFTEAKSLNLQVLHQSQGSLTYQLPGELGLYEITCINNAAMLELNTQDASQKQLNQIYDIDDNGRHTLAFEVMVNGRDMVILPLGRQVSGYLDESSVNYYESIVRQKGIIVVEMNSCLGDMDLGYSQDYDDFLEENYLESSLAGQGKH